MYVSAGSLDTSLAKLGNSPGDHQGECLLILPNGTSLGRVPSANMTLFADGLRAHLPDGRGVFIHASGAVVMDLPPEDL